MRLPFVHHAQKMCSQCYAAELLGTFCLTLAVSFALVNASVITPLVAALTLCVFVYTVGGISGAHLNPAVTVGLASVGKIAPVEALKYIAVQLLGAVAATVVAAWLVGSPQVAVEDTLKVAMGEFMGTFVLAFGVSSVVYGKVQPAASGMVIGLSLLLGILLAAATSNGVLNPAVAIGIGSVSLFYLVAPLLGGFAGAQFYKWLQS